jgi:hypothetical protein
MLLIRKHPNRKIVEADVQRWKKRFIRPPQVQLSRDPRSNEWQAKARLH